MREEGYYWVKSYGEWIVAEFSCGVWFMSGCDKDYYWLKDKDFDEIDEKRLTHE